MWPLDEYVAEPLVLVRWQAAADVNCSMVEVLRTEGEVVDIGHGYISQQLLPNLGQPTEVNKKWLFISKHINSREQQVDGHTSFTLASSKYTQTLNLVWKKNVV